MIDWNALLYFVTGGLVGFIAAERHRIWILRNGERVAEMKDHRTSEKIRQWALAVIVIACAGSAFYYAGSAQTKLDNVEQAQEALDEDQADFERQTDCQQELLANTIDALKSRSAFAEQQAKVSLAGDLAQQRFLIALTGPDQGGDALKSYMEALDRKIKATKDQLKVRDDNPYPTLTKVRSCE